MAKKTKAYGLNNPLQDVFPEPVKSQRAPTANDKRYELGQVWIDIPNDRIYALTSVVASAATWSLLGPGASDVDTLTGDGGGAISPAAGNITLAGGTNITTAGGGSTITFNLDGAITLATSVTSPIYTAAAAMDINAAAGSDITIQMGDAVGANVIDFEDSASATVATLDSDGTLTVVNMDGIIGATTPAAGTFVTATANTSVISPLYTAAAADTLVQAGGANDVILRLGDNAGATFLRIQDSDDADLMTVDSDGAMTALTGLTVAGAGISLNDSSNFNTSINGGTSTGTVIIGNGLAGAITVDSGAGFSIDGATASNVTVTGAAEDLTLGATGGSINIVATEADAAAIVINASDAAGGIDMDCGSAGFDLNVTGAGFSIDGAGTSNITATTGGTDFTVACVGGAVHLESNQAENDAIVIRATAANGGVQIQAGTGGIFIGDEADTAGITIGNAAPGQTRNIVIGSGTVVTAAVTDTISIGDDGATTNANSIKNVDINNGGVAIGEVNTYIATGAVTSGTHLTEIATGNRAAGTATVNMSTGTGTKIVNVGNADAGTTLNINAITAINTSVNAAFSACVGTSTGTVTLGNIATSGAMSLESSTTIDLDAAGAISVNSTGAAINIGNDADAFAVNVGTGAAARTTTVGSTNTTSATVIQSGTGDITMTGTVKEVTSEFLTRSGDFVTFTQSPIGQSALDTGVDPTGANGDVNLLSFQEGMLMEQFIIGTQTIIVPRMDATGLLSSLDLTATDGWELNFGAARANSRHAFTIGTSLAFFMELRFTLADVSGCEPLYFGFRKTQANQAAFGAYTDFVGYGVNNLVAGGDAIIGTRLNSGGINSTDTNDAWGDGTTHTLQVLVSAAGVTTFTFDGGPPTATQAFTFDTGDVVHPFIHNLMGAAIPGAIHLQWLKVGFQA